MIAVNVVAPCVYPTRKCVDIVIAHEPPPPLPWNHAEVGFTFYLGLAEPSWPRYIIRILYVPIYLCRGRPAQLMARSDLYHGVMARTPGSINGHSQLQKRSRAKK